MALRKFFCGLPHSTAVAWEIARQQPRMLLVPTNAWALDLRDDLNTLAPNKTVFFLPAFESDLLRNRGPSLARRLERIRFLSALSGAVPAPEDSLFVVSTEALAQKAPSNKFWHDHTFKISQGEELSREALSEKLVQLGYLPAELVESPTQFAVRGSIIDVFTPLQEHPVRIELFGDEVQSLRLFHPESQRRLEDLTEVTIVPCREFVFPASPEDLKARLRKILDDGEWDKKERDALLDRIGQQSFFPTIDFWGPLICPEAYTNVLPDFAWQACLEPQFIEAEFRAARREYEKNISSGRLDGEWVPPPAEILIDTEAGVEEVKRALGISSWFSGRQITGLPQEPIEKVVSEIKTHDILADKLTGARAESVELPLKEFVGQVREWHQAGTATVIASSTLSQLERLQFLLSQYSLSFKVFPSIEQIVAEKPPLAGVVGDLQAGFFDPNEKLSIILDSQILGTKKKRVSAQRSAALKSKNVFSGDLALLDLKPGDFVVHAEHGIGRYLGLKVINFDGVASELLETEYKDGSKLLIPVTRLSAVQKYSGGGEDTQLDRLGGQTYETKKAKVKRELQSLAGELLHLYSQREMARGPEIVPSEMKVDEFAASFAFTETVDQEQSIAACLKDLRGPRPMDRLICGDVGYGKTEIAMRAAHAAVAAGFQVAVLVPTTILAAQHESTFKKRFAPFGYNVEGISRFRSTREVKDIGSRLKEGKVDILIGTHKLLGSEISFPRLGLLIIDEEQRFGVAHKEKMRKLRANVHVLSMTATPIPRTLNMAMSGLKEMSIISTPPQDRLSVRTHVARKKDSLIKESIENELKRGGQVYYVHNRVQTIGKTHEELQQLLPGVKIEFAHGQMDEHTLEERMMNFYEGRTQVLLATSIIESGLDVPNANTLIIERADAFGLAQLYQMRGRVGRSDQRAYAYFLIPERGGITADAEERLAVLESYQELGSGFHIASHDLEIRGSGELLGRSQSGHIAAIGFDAYVQLLQECIAELKGEVLEQKIDPEINLGLDTTLPDHFIPEIGLRLMFYRRLASASDEQEIETIEKELEDRFGVFPASVRNLVSVMRIKCQLRRLGVKTLNSGKSGFSLAFDVSTPVNPAKLVESIKKYPNHFQMNPDGKLLIRRPADSQDAEKIMRGIEGALSQLESWCG